MQLPKGMAAKRWIAAEKTSKAFCLFFFLKGIYRIKFWRHRERNSYTSLLHFTYLLPSRLEAFSNFLAGKLFLSHWHFAVIPRFLLINVHYLFCRNSWLPDKSWARPSTDVLCQSPDQESWSYRIDVRSTSYLPGAGHLGFWCKENRFSTHRQNQTLTAVMRKQASDLTA